MVHGGLHRIQGERGWDVCERLGGEELGGIKLRRCGDSERRRWSVVGMGSGIGAEEWSGARRSCTVVKRE